MRCNILRSSIEIREVVADAGKQFSGVYLALHPALKRCTLQLNVLRSELDRDMS